MKRDVGIYQELGLEPIVNADSRMTAIGGSLMTAAVMQAMEEASRALVDMFELQQRVGERIAGLTNNVAAYVTAGAAAGVFLSVLGCMAGPDLTSISRMLSGGVQERQVIVHRAQRIPYDPAILLTGAQLVEVGNALQTFPWELEAAICESTVAVFFVAGDHLRRGALPLEKTITIAHSHGIPVIVDAAAQLPPIENLWHFTRNLGADLAVFSGGKDLRGPQASGLIVGRQDLIEAVRAHGSPHQRVGRLAKVGKEEMVGLLKAVELYVVEDQVARSERFERVVATWVLDLSQSAAGVTLSRDFPNEAGQPIPRTRVDLNPAQTGLSADMVQATLWNGKP